MNLQNKDGWSTSALSVASRNCHAEVVKILLENGAQVNLQEKDEWSALMIASQNGHAEVVNRLVEK